MYSIKEVYERQKNGMTIMEPQLFCMCDNPGSGGILDFQLMVPEAVTIFYAPLNCGRHVSTTPWQRNGRMYMLVEEDKDIVMGDHYELLNEAVKEILSTAIPVPKMIFICASCADRLMGTDWEGIAKRLTDNVGVPIVATWMDPLMHDRGTVTDELMKKIYSQVQPKDISEKCHAVNVIGKRQPHHADSELRKLLKDNGYGPLQHLADCKSLEEFHAMGNACLNIVTDTCGRLAAKIMYDKYQIPYIDACDLCEPEMIHDMYRKIGTILNFESDDKIYFESVKEKINDISQNAKECSMAVSNMHTAVSNPFKMSKALCRFGYDVKYIFTNGDLNESEEELRWLAEHKPDIKVIVKPLGTSVTLTKKTLDVDIAVCVNEEWFRKATKTKQVTTEYDQFDNDYASIERLIDQIEKVTEKENEV